MKNLITFFLLTILSLSLLNGCNSANSESTSLKEINETSNVKVYYFHFTHRCATCNAVEDVTKSALNEFYPTQVKSGLITFQSLNLEEKSGEALAKKLKVEGQTLLFVKGNSQINLTDDAFLNARSNPDKFKSKIKEKLDPWMK